MDKNTKVTIVTGYYNREDYVDESIQSLLDQDYDNYDIVIFDDASTDNTFQRLKLFQENNSKIKLIRHSSNIGFVRGLINAISNIDSEYIAIHGSGDISVPDRIKEQVKYLDLNPEVGMVSSRSKAKNGDNEKKYLSIQRITTENLQSGNPISHGATMFRSKVYNKVGGYREYFTFSQDYDLWLRISLVAEIHILPQFHYIKENSNDTISRNISKIIIQLMLSSYSSQLIEMRREKGYDMIDMYGNNASLFFNPKRRTNSINKLMMLQFIQGKRENMKFLISISKSINSYYLNRLLLAFFDFSFDKPVLRRIINNMLTLRLKGREVKDFRPIVQ